MGSNGSSSNPLNGLTFGEKIYFEDVGIGVSTKLGNGSKKSSSSSKSVVQNGSHHHQPPRCQVEGCKLDLSDSKAYYSRHKVCGMHSKSPLVIVAGLQQRFCQQCSRFHQLPEFDQGKRSCRRRLAGHNERRRKPPPGSLLSSRLGRLSSSLFGDSTARSGFLLDFSLYSRHPGRDLWPVSKTSEMVSGSQSPSLGKFPHSPWPGNSEDPHSKMFQQGSAGDTGFTNPFGECITGVSSDSTCALSLLSNQTWGPTNESSGTDLGNLVNLGGASISQSTSTQAVTVAHLPINNNPSWNFKGSENGDANIGFHGASSDNMGLGQFSHLLSNGLHSDLFMDQAHGGRPYMEVDHSRGYSSGAASEAHWSL